MRSYRIGKTLKIRWGILTGGKSEPLSGRDLRLEIATGSRFRRNVPFKADDSVAEFLFQGSEQRYVGAYTLTMWENRGKENQTVVDRCDAFCLVACSCEESAESADEPNLDVETLELGSSNLETGVPGMSAYELFKRHNPDSALTEEEYAEAPVQAAEAALAMVEQLEKTDAAVKQAEQGREASERVRTTAEQARVTAEQQRALAEQTRVTNESARQTAEAGRRTAEAKREQNTSEAIRNSEEAARKAEDEAARVRTLADNPPKIVEVDGARYWAFWDEATEQYVTSENRADVGDAVLFSPQTLTNEQQEQVQKNISPGGYLRPLFEAAGAVYDEGTGFYQMNGINDLTYSDLIKAWRYFTTFPNDYNTDFNFTSAFAGESIRTNFPFPSYFLKCSILNLYGQNLMEVFCAQGLGSTQYLYISGLNVFLCNKIVKILGTIDVGNINNPTNITDAGSSSSLSKLESVYFRNLKVDLTILRNSPYLTYDSISYLLNNAANTSAITVTVHSTTYGYLTGTIQPTEQVGGTTEEWQALVTTALGKQISFASA